MAIPAPADEAAHAGAAAALSVLFVYRAFYPIRGGIPRIVEELAARLAADGGRAVVLTAMLDASPEHEVHRGIHVYREPGLEHGRVSLSRLSKIFREHGVNCVLITDPLREELIIACYAKLKAGVPVLLNLAGTYAERSGRVSRWWAGRMASSIVAISEYCRLRYGFFQNRVSIVPMGTQLPSTGPTSERRRDLIVTVGWMSARKGYDQLLDTAKLLPHLRFSAVGNKELSPQYVRHLEDRLRAEQISNVALLGQLADAELSRLLWQARVFFLPTTHEMYGLAFLDAMAHGLPIVSCPVAAVPEAVPPEVGLLVEAGPRAFADAIQRLISDELLWRSMSAAAIERARQHTWERTYEAYRDCMLLTVGS